VLFGATSIGRDLAPRLSARLHTGLTADCTKLEMDEEGNLFMTRPAFGGNLFATIICPEHRPQMSTVRPGVMKKPEYNTEHQGEIIMETVDFDDSKAVVKVVEEVRETKNVERIEDAKILVSCGRGVKDTNPAFDVAKKVKGTVSASRSLVDAGIIEHSRQVGQTGKTVRPEAYLAFGISGAIQHLAGMEESEYIIAVNTDVNAPIFKVANLGIVCDAGAVLKQLDKIL
jgi:electron transfer flavoprotein alpha subunit